ncbi:hypothetical protein EUX98_g9717 [Antrodiella citrinella]|uniref:Uncharacterized protein n=1 Tax=Antrodiella citrinella TaxID=2447956 RepID=A0A4S4LNF3_9APHY|nr:hypothetical protein EUX98_g9717 [Antrodiella citrinella]
MHASTIALLAIAAAAAPAFSQPLYARHPKIKAEDIKDGIDMGSDIINATGNLKQVITGHSRREFLTREFLTRAYEEELMARQDDFNADVIEYVLYLRKFAVSIAHNLRIGRRKRGSLTPSFVKIASGQEIKKPKPRACDDELMARAFGKRMATTMTSTDVPGGKTLISSMTAANVRGEPRPHRPRAYDDELMARAYYDELMARDKIGGKPTTSTKNVGSPKQVAKPRPRPKPKPVSRAYDEELMAREFMKRAKVAHVLTHVSSNEKIRRHYDDELMAKRRLPFFTEGFAERPGIHALNELD